MALGICEKQIGPAAQESRATQGLNIFARNFGRPRIPHFRATCRNGHCNSHSRRGYSHRKPSRRHTFGTSERPVLRQLGGRADSAQRPPLIYLIPPQTGPVGDASVNTSRGALEMICPLMRLQLLDYFRMARYSPTIFNGREGNALRLAGLFTAARVAGEIW